MELFKTFIFYTLSCLNIFVSLDNTVHVHIEDARTEVTELDDFFQQVQQSKTPLHPRCESIEFFVDGQISNNYINQIFRKIGRKETD